MFPRSQSLERLLSCVSERCRFHDTRDQALPRKPYRQLRPQTVLKHVLVLRFPSATRSSGHRRIERLGCQCACLATTGGCPSTASAGSLPHNFHPIFPELKPPSLARLKQMSALLSPWHFPGAVNSSPGSSRRAQLTRCCAGGEPGHGNACKCRRRSAEGDCCRTCEGDTTGAEAEPSEAVSVGKGNPGLAYVTDDVHLIST